MKLLPLLMGLVLISSAQFSNTQNLEDKQFNASSRSIIRNNMYNVVQKLFELHMYLMHDFIQAQKPTLKGLWYKLYNKWSKQYKWNLPHQQLSSYSYNQPEKHLLELQNIIRDNEQLWTEADEQCAYEIACSATSHPQWNNPYSVQSRKSIINEILIQKDLPAWYSGTLFYERNFGYAGFWESFLYPYDRRVFCIYFMVDMLIYDFTESVIALFEGPEKDLYSIVIDNPFI